MSDSSSADRPPATPPPARPALNHRAVIVAALGLVEAEGLQALNMRALGERLGVRGASTYRWILSREVLLHDMADFLDRSAIERLVDWHPREAGWRDVMLRQALGLRETCVLYPRSFPLLLAVPPDLSWVRAPLRNGESVEMLLLALRASGFSRAAAVAAYRGFTAFLLGELLLDAETTTNLRGDSSQRGRTTRPGPAWDLGGHPTVSVLLSPLSALARPEAFTDSLDHLLVRVEAMRLPRAGAPRSSPSHRSTDGGSSPSPESS